MRRQEEEQKEERRRQAEVEFMNSLSQIHENFQLEALRLQHHNTLNGALISAEEFEAAKGISRSLPQLKEIRFTENKQVTTTDNEQLVLFQILSLLPNMQQQSQNQNRRCFNCGTMGNLQNNCRNKFQATKEESNNEIRKSPSSTSVSLSQSSTRKDDIWSLRNRFPTADDRKEQSTMESEVIHLKEQLAISKNEIERLREQMLILQEKCKVIRTNAITTQSNLENKCQKLIKEKNVLNKQLQEFQNALNELQVQSQCQLAQKENATEEVNLQMTTVEQQKDNDQTSLENLKKIQKKDNDLRVIRDGLKNGVWISCQRSLWQEISKYICCENHS
uniref:Uncharacterized protein LOC114338631 n=1 Tax=Diabrotica virgifera virgifera TaxID=50390 RepID=A0A6P7GFX2_DIAVI